MAVVPFPVAAPWLQLHCRTRLQPMREPAQRCESWSQHSMGSQADEQGHTWNTRSVCETWVEIVDEAATKVSAASDDISCKSQRSSVGPSSGGSVHATGPSRRAQWCTGAISQASSACLLAKGLSLPYCARLCAPRVMLVPSSPSNQDKASPGKLLHRHASHIDDVNTSVFDSTPSPRPVASGSRAGARDLLLRLRADAQLDARYTQGRMTAAGLQSSGETAHSQEYSHTRDCTPARTVRALAVALQRACSRSRRCRDALRRVALAAQKADTNSCRCRCDTCRTQAPAPASHVRLDSLLRSQQRSRREQELAAAAAAGVRLIQQVLDTAMRAFNSHMRQGGGTFGQACRHTGEQLRSHAAPPPPLTPPPSVRSGLSAGEQLVLHHTARLASAPCLGFDTAPEYEPCGGGGSAAELRETLAARSAAGLQYSPQTEPCGAVQSRDFIRGSRDTSTRAVRARLLGARCAAVGAARARELRLQTQTSLLQESMQRGYAASAAVDDLMRSQRAEYASAALQGRAHPALPAADEASPHAPSRSGSGSCALRSGWVALAQLENERKAQVGVEWGAFNEHFMGPLYAPLASQ